MALRPGQRESTATISGIFFGRASTGNEQVVITCECTDGQDAGASLLYFGTFHGDSFEYTEKALRACGWQGDDLSELPELAAAGKLGPVKLVIEDKPRAKDGKVFPTIVFVNPLGGGSFQFKEESRIEGAALKQLGARMRSAFAGTRARGAAPASRPPGVPAAKPASAPPKNAARPAGKSAGQDRFEQEVPPISDADMPFD